MQNFIADGIHLVLVCVNSSVARFDSKFSSKFHGLIDNTVLYVVIVAMQPNMGKMLSNKPDDRLLTRTVFDI